MIFQNCKKAKFSFPMPLNVSADFITNSHTLEQLGSMKDNIRDIYFTCHIPPFSNDAHGVQIDPTENYKHFRDMLRLQEKTGIKISALFNNIFVPNSLHHLKMFIKNLKPFYAEGLRSITQPHTMWMKFGILQKEFPELEIKNTILRRVRNGQDFWNAAIAGFDYVNLDRILMRDLAMLKEIKRTQLKFQEDYGKYVSTSLLTNEGCLGNCPVWEEHYQHSITNPNVGNPETHEAIVELPRSLFCNAETYNKEFNTVTFTPFREDVEEILGLVDVVKLAGRKYPNFLGPFLKGIHEITTKENSIIEFFLAFPNVPFGVLLSNNETDLINRWRTAIKKCRFQCYRCDICSTMSSKAIFHNQRNFK